MKTMILNATILLILVGNVVSGAKAIDPREPLYQTNILLPDCIAKTHPGLDVVDHPKQGVSVEDQEKLIKFENMNRAAERGRGMISMGLSAIVLGAMLVFFLKQYHLQWIGLGVCGFGVWRFSAGILEIKLAENWEVATGAAAVVVLIGIAAAMLWPRGIDLSKAKKLIPKLEKDPQK